MASRMVLLLAAAVVFFTPLRADSLWQEGLPSLFSDRRAFRVGDVLTVKIVENASAKNEATTRTNNDFSTEVSGGPGTGPLDFIPGFAVAGGNK
ncbi:flagellar basal body L-ring protein FlgH, partial [candidate division KSB1 bacterium]